MSETLEKAVALEEKEKWKNAADTYFKAADEFISIGKPVEAKNAYLKALANAEKIENYSLMIECIYSYIKMATDDEKKAILTKAFTPLDILLEDAVTKKKFELIFEYISKKEEAARITNNYFEETLIEKGKYLHEYALSLITGKKIEERKKAFDILTQASNILLEIDRKEEKINGELEALKTLIEEGFLKEGLQLFNEIVDFCHANGLESKADETLLILIENANEILGGRGSKKLLKELKTTYSETDPGGELLNIVIEKAQTINSIKVIAKASEIQADYARQLFEKKNYQIAMHFFDKALKLLIIINEKEAASILSEDIVNKGYFLFEQKGKFKLALDYFNIIQQLGNINLEALGDILYSKAHFLFSLEKLDLALDDYIKASEAYLSGNITEKFSQSTETLFTKALSLIERNKYSTAYNYVNNSIILLEGNQAFEQIGLNTTLVAISLIKAKQIKESEEYSVKAIEYLINARNILEAGKAHRIFGESFIGLEQYDLASYHFIEAAKMFREGESHDEILSTTTPLLISAKNKLTEKKVDLAQKLIMNASLCAEQKGPVDQTNILIEFIDHAISINNYKIALDNLSYAVNILGISYPVESNKLVQKLLSIGKQLILTDQNFELAKKYIDLAISSLVELKENLKSSDFVLEYSQLFLDQNQKEIAKNLLIQIPNVLGNEIQADIFSEKTSLAAKILINNNFIIEGIDLFRKTIGSYISLGLTEPVIDLSYYCAEQAKMAIESNELISAKHLYISAMEFSLLANLEVYDQILSDATNNFLDLNDLYTVREFYDFAKNNLEGEKDYLVKLGRMIVYQGGILRDNKNLLEEASEFIKLGIKIINQTGMLTEAGEAALAQGNAFIAKDHFVFGEELIETGAQIFLQLNDINRSGEAFQSLAEINLHRQLWEDAYRQIELANKSFLEAKNYVKLSNSIIKTADIGFIALTFNPKKYREFAIRCFEKAISLAKVNQLNEAEIESYLRQGRGFMKINDFLTAFNIFSDITNILEQLDDKEKSPIFADEISSYALTFISNNEIELGLHIIGLSTGIYLRLGQPIKASEVYMKSCNNLLKINQIVEGVKLVLLASDTLMVANEYEQAAKILEEIVDLLYGLKDYKNASIVTGQIVTVHQKTGNIKEQKKAINKLVVKAKEIIASGKIMDGEHLWENASNYSISTNIEFALEIYNARIENLLSASMFNSVNNAFTQLLSILENNKEELFAQGNRVSKIARDLYINGELVLSKNFIITAVEFYKKSNNFDKARNFCIEMSEEFINRGDETNGIDLIDQGAAIANEKYGAHEAAKIYLNAGFILIEKNYQSSGQMSVNKAIDIEIQTKNTQGCIELGEISLKRAADMANSNLEIATKYYGQASIIFERAESYTRAGEASTIISTNYLSLGNIAQALEAIERSINLYLKDRNIDMATSSLKQIIEASRRLFEENEITKAVLILEKSRFLVEKVTKFELLDLIVSIYLFAASQNLPNRKSAIGMFFLNRAVELSKTSPDPEEFKKVVDLSLKLSIEIIKKKNSLAGAKIIEKISKQELAKQNMLQLISNTYIEAVKQTLDIEWNMITKITRDAIRFFNETNQINLVSQIMTILIKRANADILLDKPQLGFFFLDHTLRLIYEFENQNLLLHIGQELLEQIQVMEDDSDLYNKYKLLGYCYQIFQESQNLEFIERVGLEFVKLGSKDLIVNMQSLRGYDALLTARDIAAKTQSNKLMSTVVLALLDFAQQLSENNTMTTLSTLDDIINGLEAYEIPKSNRAEIDYNLISSHIKFIITFGDKICKSQDEYQTGKKIIENCLRILSLSKNKSFIDKDILDIQDDMSKLFKKANRDAAFQLRHGALIIIDDVSDTNIAVSIAENSFRTAQALFEKRKYSDSINFLETSLKISEVLSLSTELKNIGLFALSAGDQLVNEAKIEESMIYFDIAVEAFDIANDEENSNRLVNRIFQTREWDADITIAYRVYKIASESAIRIKNWRKAHEIANKCFNRGIAFIDQPRIPSNLTLKFISLAGKTFEDIGAIRDAANAYDNAILKYIRLMKSRKNIDQIIAELIVKTAVTRMASCDMDSLETIFLRVMELAEMKKVKFTKIIARTLKLINATKVGDAWDLIASLPFVSHGRIRKIINATKGRIIYDLQQKGTFDRTVLSTTDRSLPLSDYLIDTLLITRKIDGQPINKDVFISMDKLKDIRSYFYSEYELWGRIELDAISNEHGIQSSDVASIIRREFLSALYMGILDNEQKVFYSFDRLKAEIGLILNREKKKSTRFDPMQVATEMRIAPDIIKEVLREISCDEVVENVAA